VKIAFAEHRQEPQVDYLNFKKEVSKVSEKDQETEHRSLDLRATREQSLIMMKVIFYLKKSSLEEGHHASRHGYEST